MAIFVPILLGTAIGYARGWPESWRAASWESSGVLPDARSEPEASVRILAARTGRWKGIFAVHTWIVMKGKGDDRGCATTSSAGAMPVRRDNYAADAFWYGNTPYVVNEVRGAAAERMIPEIERVIAALSVAGAGFLHGLARPQFQQLHRLAHPPCARARNRDAGDRHRQGLSRTGL